MGVYEIKCRVYFEIPCIMNTADHLAAYIMIVTVTFGVVDVTSDLGLIQVPPALSPLFRFPVSIIVVASP
jgi:hypothetical protein